MNHMHVLYYTDDDGGGWYEVTVVGVFTSQEKAEKYADEVSKEYTTHINAETEKRKRNQKMLTEFLLRNSAAVRLDGQTLEDRIKLLTNTYLYYFSNKMKLIKNVQDRLHELLNFKKLSEPLPELEDDVPFREAHPGCLPFDRQRFRVEITKLDPEVKKP